MQLASQSCPTEMRQSARHQRRSELDVARSGWEGREIELAFVGGIHDVAVGACNGIRLVELGDVDDA